MARPENFSDDDLVKLLRFDDEAAFTEIYNRHWRKLFYTAYNITRIESSAQDIVQDIFLSLWNRRHEVEIVCLNAYLHQAARYAVLKLVRDMRCEATFHERLQTITTEIIQDDPLIFKEKQELLNQLIGSLPEKCSTAYSMSREEGLTYKQIAVRLEISQKTVEKRISTSLKHLRTGLKGDFR
jgi:RNA polymerase sigma-70 factor (ECF subfamily)